MNTFTITLEQCAFFGYHGIHEEEQRNGNDFIVDVTIVINSKDFEDARSLDSTIDYQIIYKIVQERMSIATPLLETIALKIVEDIEKSFSNILEIATTIYKKNPPLGGLCKSSKVTYCKKINA